MTEIIILAGFCILTEATVGLWVWIIGDILECQRRQTWSEFA